MKYNQLKSGLSFVPHFQKKTKGGEDAAAVTSNLVAVADGVSGWAKHGVDPAVYSRKLCSLIDMLVRMEPKYIDDPKKLLIDVVGMNKETGSSTCVLASLD